MSIKRLIVFSLIIVMFASLFCFTPAKILLAESALPSPSALDLSLRYDEQNKPYVRLTWEAPEGGQSTDGYNIYRVKIENPQQVTLSLDDYEKIQENIKNLYYDDLGAEYGCTYHYVVTALYGALESEGSGLYNSGSADVPPVDMVFATDSISLNGNSFIQGTAGTNSNEKDSVSFNNENSRIIGDFYYGPEANWNSNNITGNIYNLPSVRNYPLPDFPAFPGSLPQGEIKRGFFGSTRTISKDGYFDTISVGNGETLIIQSNNETRIIRVGELDIKGSLVLETNQTGKVLIYVEDSLNIDGEINNNGNPEKLTIYYAGNDEIKLAGNSVLSGTLYAENSDIQLSGNNTINGCIITSGTSIKSSGNADARFSIIYAPNAHLDFSGNFNLFGTVVSKELSLAGNASITYESSTQSVLNQFDWGSVQSSPSDNIITIPGPILSVPDAPSKPVLTLMRDPENKPYVNVAWEAPSGITPVTGYNVYRLTITDPLQRTSSLSDYELIAENIRSLSYDDKQVEEGKTYHYVITALSGIFESGGTELYFPLYGASNNPPSLDMIFATDSITLTGSSKIIGDTGTNSTTPGSIDLGWSTKIDGNLLVGPQGDWSEILKVYRDNPLDNVSGSIGNLDKIQEYPLPKYPEFPGDLPYRGNFSTNWVAGEYYLIDSDGYYDTISVFAGRTLTIDLNYGTRIIRVKNLNIQQGHIVLKNAGQNGKLILYVDNLFNLTGSSTINNNGDYNRVNLYYSGDNSVTIIGTTKFYGSIYFKQAGLTLSGSNNFIGHIISGSGLVEVSGAAYATVGVVYVPNGTLSVLGSGKIKGIAVAANINVVGTSTITFDDSIDYEFLEQLEWTQAISTPSDNTITIPIDELPPIDMLLAFDFKVKTVTVNLGSGESGGEDPEYLDQIKFLAGDYIPIEVSLSPNFTILNPVIKLDLSLRDPDNDFEPTDQFDVFIEPTKTVVTKNDVPISIPKMDYPYNIIAIPGEFLAGDTLKIDYTVKTIPTKNKVNYDINKKYVVRFDIVEMLITNELGEQVLYVPTEEYVGNFTAELIIVDPKIMQ